MRRLTVALIVLVLSVPLGSGVASAAGQDVRVSALGTAFAPALAEATLLDTVVWVNDEAVGGARHTVTATSGEWNINVDLAPGESVRVEFPAAGTYGYVCLRHAGMTGEVVVGKGLDDGITSRLDSHHANDAGVIPVTGTLELRGVAESTGDPVTRVMIRDAPEGTTTFSAWTEVGFSEGTWSVEIDFNPLAQGAKRTYQVRAETERAFQEDLVPSTFVVQAAHDPFELAFFVEDEDGDLIPLPAEDPFAELSGNVTLAFQVTHPIWSPKQVEARIWNSKTFSPYYAGATGAPELQVLKSTDTPPSLLRQGSSGIYKLATNIPAPKYYPGGQWATSNLPDGLYDLSLTVIVADGTTTTMNAVQTARVDLDNHRHVLGPAGEKDFLDRGTVGGVIAFSGTVEGDADVTAVEWTVLASCPTTPAWTTTATWNAATYTPSTRAWSFTYATSALATATQCIDIRARPGDGPVYARLRERVAIQNVPGILFESPMPSASISGVTTIVGALSAPGYPVQKVEVKIDGGPARAATVAGGTWSYALDTTPLTNADHTVQATVTTTSGHTALASRTFRVANTPTTDLRATLTPPPATQTAAPTATTVTGTLFNDGNTKVATSDNTALSMKLEYNDGTNWIPLTFTTQPSFGVANGFVEGFNSATFTLTWTRPQNEVYLGTFQVRVTVDPTGKVTEANEANNVATGTATWVAGAAPRTIVSQAPVTAAVTAATATANAIVACGRESTIDGTTANTDTGAQTACSTLAGARRTVGEHRVVQQVRLDVPALVAVADAVDADRDGIPDDVEPALCLVESPSDPQDGSCTTDDDFVGPVGRVDADGDGYDDRVEPLVCAAGPTPLGTCVATDLSPSPAELACAEAAARMGRAEATVCADANRNGRIDPTERTTRVLP